MKKQITICGIFLALASVLYSQQGKLPINPVPLALPMDRLHNMLVGMVP